MWETMGPIADRPRERLGASDLAVVEFRRLMVEAAITMRDTGIEISRPVVPADRIGGPGEEDTSQLSYAEMQRLLSQPQPVPLLSPGAEIAVLQRLLDEDATDLRLLRRLRDLQLIDAGPSWRVARPPERNAVAWVLSLRSGPQRVTAYIDHGTGRLLYACLRW